MNYTYKAVETALASLHDVPQGATGAFRGRIKNLQRLGLVPSSPGVGKHILYSYEDVAKWAFALELAQCDMNPLVILRFVNDVWSMVKPDVVTPSRGLLVYEPKIMSDPYGWSASACMTDEAGFNLLIVGGIRCLTMIDVEGLYSRLTNAITAAVTDSRRINCDRDTATTISELKQKLGTKTSAATFRAALALARQALNASE